MAYCCDMCWQENGQASQALDDKDFCLECHGFKSGGEQGPVSCLKCFRQQFCSYECREAYAHEHCGGECWEENVENGEADEDEDLKPKGAFDNMIDCIVCGDSLNVLTGRMIDCSKCERAQYCTPGCQVAHLDEFCDSDCERLSTGSSKKKASSIMDDPRNYEGMTGSSTLEDPLNFEGITGGLDMLALVAESMVDGQCESATPKGDVKSASSVVEPPPAEGKVYNDRIYSVIGHRLTSNGRCLQYHVEKQRPKTREWAMAVLLAGDTWTAKLAAY